LGRKLWTIGSSLILSVISSVAFPLYSRLQGDLGRMENAILQLGRYGSMLIVPASFGLAVVASMIIPVMFGPQWGPSVPILQLASVAGLAHLLHALYGDAINAHGRPQITLKIHMVKAVVVVAAIAVAAQFGIVQVALAVMLVDLAMAPVDFAVTRRLFGFHPMRQLRQLVAPLAAGGIMVIVVLLSRSALVAWAGDSVSAVWQLVVGVGVGAVAYTTALVLMAPELRRMVMESVRTLSVRPILGELG
jgi:O-antigen/teichoic acid export membrane protein